MNINGIKLQPGLFRHRMNNGITCSVRSKFRHIKMTLSSYIVARVVIDLWKERFHFYDLDH